MALRTITAFYGSGKNQQEVFVHTDRNGSWYCPVGGTIVFHTEEDLTDGINIENIDDDAEFGWTKIFSEEDLYEAIVDEI